MDMRLANQVALVAGSTQGIGEAIVRTFLAEGGRVVISGRRPERLEEVALALSEVYGPEKILSFCGDLTQPADIEKAVRQTLAHWGAIDCLVANIGSGVAKMGWELTDSDWQSVFEQNFWGSIRLVQAVLPHMVDARRGSIVFTSSIAGVESISAPLPYSTAKAALLSYCKGLSREVGPYSVRVNCVAPGNVLFPGGSWDRKLQERREHFMQYVQREVALQRFGKPEEIADVVVFLCSERATFITGACVVVDGGQTRSY